MCIIKYYEGKVNTIRKVSLMDQTPKLQTHQFLTPKQFMERHNLSRTTVYGGIRDGSIPSVTISKRKILIPSDALDRKLAEVGHAT